MSYIKFIFPINGDCINSNDGKMNNNLVHLKVLVESDSDILFINDKQALRNGNLFESYVDVAYGPFLIRANDKTITKEIKIYRLKSVEKLFRISVDDNILFLKDITENKSKYTSIFDNQYLNIFKEVHDKTGAKININLFYETSDLYGFNKPIEYFNLSMMTDKFKNEFIDNSSWLRLSFHSRKEYPGNPYHNTKKEVIAGDIDLVNNEIIRFAGKEALSKETTIHFGATNKESTKECIDKGYKALNAFFEISDNKPIVSYHYDIELVKHCADRDFWYDDELKCLYSKIDRVMNCSNDRNENIKALNEIINNPTKNQFVEIMIHEQYFYNEYENYLSNFKNLVLDSALFLKEKGYTSCFLNDVLLKNEMY